MRARIERLLPPGWAYDGKRVLDFGCGSARVLRQFLDEAERGEFWGCDIDGPSIDWVKTNLSPPLHCFQNDPAPPLPLDGGSFDLIWAMSVFTHITDLWSDWLLEMHRILAPGGVLLASFLGEGVWEPTVRLPYREDEVGMAVVGHWMGAGAQVFHSEWWLREHWGRAFDVVEVSRPPRSADGSPEIAHSYIVLSMRPVEIGKDELERCDPDEPRELAGLKTSLRLTRLETHIFAEQSFGPARSRLREAVLGSPLAGPARKLRKRLRKL